VPISAFHSPQFYIGIVPIGAQICAGKQNLLLNKKNPKKLKNEK